jgi:hypothetical protein
VRPGTFVGLLVCPLFGLGYTLDDIRRDIVKCFLVSLSIVLLMWGICCWIHPLVLMGTFPTVLIPVGILAWFVINSLWRDFSMGQILMVECFVLSTISIVAIIIFMLLAG